MTNLNYKVASPLRYDMLQWEALLLKFFFNFFFLISDNLYRRTSKVFGEPGHRLDGLALLSGQTSRTCGQRMAGVLSQATITCKFLTL
jgi:hypothetical protein